MNKIKHLYLFGVLFLSTYFTTSAQNIPCDHPDYDALVAFYNTTDGANWTQKWDLSDCNICDWFGISCDPLTNRVNEILLTNNNLSGELPPQIGDLTYLIRLELSNNQLSGTIPSEIEKLTPILGFTFGLRFLVLDNNELSGPIPLSIGNLSGGSLLDLSNNQFSGALPNNLANFGNEVNLNILKINVANNQLSGCFPNNLDKFCPGDAFISFSALGNTDLPNNGDLSLFCETNDGTCTPNEVMGCEALEFIGATKQINVSGLTTTSKVEIIGRNTDYQTIIVCEDDCEELQIIPNLTEGAYTVKVNLFDGENYCYREELVTVMSDDNNPSGMADCNRLIFSGESEQITIEGLSAAYNKVEIIGHNTDWQIITICDGNCDTTQIIPDLAAGNYAVKINQSGTDGSYCYREESVTVTSEVINNDDAANCESLVFESGDSSITVNGLTANYSKVEILGRNTDWQVVTICDGDCDSTQIITNLTAGEYTVKINQRGNDGSYCYREEQVIIENSNQNRNGQFQIEDDIILYPNPARNYISLKSEKLASKVGTIHIYNTFGQIVQSIPSIQFDGNVVAIDLADYENGIYLMTIQVEKLPIISSRFLLESLK